MASGFRRGTRRRDGRVDDDDGNGVGPGVRDGTTGKGAARVRQAGKLAAVVFAALQVRCRRKRRSVERRKTSKVQHDNTQR